VVEDDEIDPINIRMSQALDRRFARFDFASDNSPQSEGGSVAINGSVAFGIRHQTSPSGPHESPHFCVTPKSLNF
jgi:hypothetical protein